MKKKIILAVFGVMLALTACGTGSADTPENVTEMQAEVAPAEETSKTEETQEQEEAGKPEVSEPAADPEASGADIAGVYKCFVDGFINTITLNEDGTGLLSFQDDVEVTWDAQEIRTADYAYRYSVNGDQLILDHDGFDLTFSKNPADLYVGTWAEASAERVILTIRPAESGEEGLFDAIITWREDGLAMKDRYTMQPHAQEDGSLYYENCTYVQRFFEEDGSYSDELQYENGSGLLYYDEEANTLYWTDYTIEDKTENVTSFIRNDELAVEGIFE